MARKPTKAQQKYWEKVLHDHGLGMNRGDGSSKVEGGKNLIEFGGSIQDLEIIESQEVARKTGRKKPKG